MSRPRKPYGAQQPGRLQSTMMKVLAAEMSDPQRLKRGKQYAKDGSVTDIVVERGVVTCEIQGSRSTPYIAALEVTQGDGMPLRRDVNARCTCPDDANWDSHACKHVLATMFVFADELLIEPELLDLWRANDRADLDPLEARRGADPGSVDAPDEVDDPRDTSGVVRSFDPDAEDPAEANSLRRSRWRVGHDSDDARSIFDDLVDDDLDGGDSDAPGDDDRNRLGRRRRHLQLVREGMEQGRAERREQQTRRSRDPIVDPLVDVLAFPEGAALPDVTVEERPDAPSPARPELAAILRDAHRNLRLDWD